MKVVQFTVPVARNHSIHIQEDLLPHFYEHLHRHTETQITYIIKGSGTLIAGNIMQPYGPGDLFIIGANQSHLFKSDPDYFEKEGSLNIHSLNIYFDSKGYLNNLLQFPEMSMIQQFIDTTSQGLQASPDNSSLLSDYMWRIIQNTQGYRLAAFIEMLQTMSKLRDWKYLSTESIEQPISDYEGLRMNDIYQYTMANYSDNISLEEIAAVIHLTPQSFCRYFRKHTLKTYTNFLNEVRVNEACKKFMAHDFSSISAIAYQTGFNNVSTFNRVFKSIIGISPSEYIHQYKTKISSQAHTGS
ncbi:MAG TPA: AraC family transcriptional regulator [Hanamia sp.]|nr:AraC family transcriptional regulator [Hanamia sp.]